MPTSLDEWRNIAQNFYEKWQFPNCLGALDGKHIAVRAPPKSGSLYFNYKGFFSIVLLALVDASGRFLYIDVGAYGRNSDGGILSNSSLGEALNQDLLNLPNPTELPVPGASELGAMPYVIIADEAFPLTGNIMRPYPGKSIDRDKQVFNYRLSRARRIVEAAFGMLSQKWRVFDGKVRLDPSTTKVLVKTCCILHNLALESTVETVETRSDLPPSVPAPTSPIGGTAIRENFKKFFNDFPLRCQNAYIDRQTFS